LHFEIVPHPWALPIIKHKAKFIVNQTYVNHEVYGWEGFYVYSSIVVRSLNLQVGIISIPSLRSGIISMPIFRRKIEGYKVPSTYTTNFILGALQVRELSILGF
jgi:hypothetical protein